MTRRTAENRKSAARYRRRSSRPAPHLLLSQDCEPRFGRLEDEGSAGFHSANRYRQPLELLSTYVCLFYLPFEIIRIQCKFCWHCICRFAAPKAKLAIHPRIGGCMICHSEVEARLKINLRDRIDETFVALLPRRRTRAKEKVFRPDWRRLPQLLVERSLLQPLELFFLITRQCRRAHGFEAYPHKQMRIRRN